jgi:hypothetical protein
MLPAVFGEKAGGLPRRVLANRILAALGEILSFEGRVS